MVDSRYWRRKWWLWLWWLRIYCDGGFKQHWLHGECPFNVDFTISFICFLFVLKFSPCQPWNFCNYCTTSLLLTISSQYLSYDIHDGDENDGDGFDEKDGDDNGEYNHDVKDDDDDQNVWDGDEVFKLLLCSCSSSTESPVFRSSLYKYCLWVKTLTIIIMIPMVIIIAIINTTITRELSGKEGFHCESQMPSIWFSTS